MLAWTRGRDCATATALRRRSFSSITGEGNEISRQRSMVCRICALLVCCCGCFASLRLRLVKIGWQQTARTRGGAGRGKRVGNEFTVVSCCLQHKGVESSSAPFYDMKFDESTACRLQGRRAAKLFRCTGHGTLSIILAGRYGSSSEIAPLLSKNDLKYIYLCFVLCMLDISVIVHATAVV